MSSSESNSSSGNGNIILNINSAKTVLRRYRQNECELLIKRKEGNRPTKLTADVLTKIERIVETNPGFTLAIIKQKLAEQNLPLSLSSIQNGLSKLRITLKLASLEMESMNSPRTIALRKEYANELERRDLPTNGNKDTLME